MEIEKEKLESTIAGLFRSLSDVEFHIEELRVKGSKYYKQTLKNKANMFRKEIKKLSDNFYEDSKMSEEKFEEFTDKIKRNSEFVAKVVSNLSETEQEMVDAYIKKLRENKDTEGVDMDKEPETEGVCTVSKVITFFPAEVDKIASNYDVTTEEGQGKLREECFAIANKNAGDGWEYNTHSFGNDKILRVIFTKINNDEE